MAVYTDLLRHLNAKWIVDKTNENMIYCGLSTSDLVLDENNVNISTALDNCHIFVKVNSFFIKESNEESFDVKMLTKQNYSNNYYYLSDNNHSFLDNVCYWSFISEQEALEKHSYITVLFFNIDNRDSQHYQEFKNIKSFCFFYNFKINNSIPESEQNLRKQSDLYTADYVIIKERIGFVHNVDHGVCEPNNFKLDIEDGVKERINYFLSF